MQSIYLIVTILCLLGLIIRTVYERRKQASTVDSTNKVVFSVVFIGMSLMLMSWPFLSIYDPLPIPIPSGVRFLGYGVVLLGLGLAVGGLIQLRGLENIDHLVTNGIFSRIRHPMYTGFILWVLGWILSNGAVMGLALGFICVLCILYWRNLEEQNLFLQFGDRFTKYQKSTWF